MLRVNKAIKYVNKHKSKKTFYTAQDWIVVDLRRAERTGNLSINGDTHYFIGVVNKRFKSAFLVQELILILRGITGSFTKKQVEHYDWI